MTLNLRLAQPADAADLLAWRNDPKTRALSRQQAEISWDDHCRWVDRMVADPGCLFLVAWQDDVRVGVVRFNRRGQTNVWEVSITVAPAAQGRGLGGRMLNDGVARLRRDHPGAEVLAAVLPGNLASERLFLGAGFRPTPSDEAFAHFVLEA